VKLLADFRAEFPKAENGIYLNSATMTLGSQVVLDSYEFALKRWLDGSFPWDEAITASDTCRERFAKLINAESKDISVQPSVSAAAGAIAFQIPKARAGENVILGDREFASNYMPWEALAERGYEIRRVPVDVNQPQISDYEALIDSNTRFIAISAVQSSTGHAVDRRKLCELAHDNGARVFIDAAQAGGAIKIDVKKENIDYLACPSYKFLLGTRGMGYLYVKPSLQKELKSPVPNWLSTEKPAEQYYAPDLPLSKRSSVLDGPVAWFAAIADQHALELFHRHDPEKIWKHNQNLSRQLGEGLDKLGFDFKERLERDQISTVYSFYIKNPDKLDSLFQARNVKSSVRSGKVRLAVHAYNTADEIDEVLEMIKECS
jgi:selenocysteine lyase/cysteine desulfurase